jgi:hypothetical protein
MSSKGFQEENCRPSSRQVRASAPRRCTGQPATITEMHASADRRDQVGRALEQLAAGLGPFVDERMRAARGVDWYTAFTEQSYGRSGGRALEDPRFYSRL